METAKRKYYRSAVGSTPREEVTEDRVRDVLGGVYVDVDLAMDALHANGSIPSGWGAYETEEDK